MTLPQGGQWKEGTPDDWAPPTVTYGTGKFQATLNWTNNSSHYTDLDLHLYGPNEMHVSWENEISSDGVFQLDRDWQEEVGSATENIFSLKNELPSGKYQVKVQLYSGDPVNFNTRVILDGKVKTYSGNLSTTDSEQLIYEFEL
ncbi:MAG: hypothetical protein R2771_11685 [Saprospiraceae bacterium]